MKRHAFALRLSTALFLFALTLAPCSLLAQQPWDKPAFTADAKQLLKAANEAAKDSSDEATVLFQDVRVVIDAEGRQTTSRHLIYRVNNDKGVESWAESSQRWEPWLNEQPTIEARVITPDGVVHKLDPKTLVDAPAREDDNDTYGDDRRYKAPLPAIAVGAVVEEREIIREKIPFLSGAAAGRIYVGFGVASKQLRVTIESHAGKPLLHAEAKLPDAKVSLSEANGVQTLVIEQGPTEAIDNEGMDNLPPDQPDWPQVNYTTAASWAEVAATYQKVLEPRIKVEEVSERVRPFAKLDRDARIRAILKLLHKEVRYTGLEFGVSKLEPQTPGEILRRKYGDCKDKAALLSAMLRASGIPSYVALLNTGDDAQDPTLSTPGLRVFNHAIAFVPGENGGKDLWIDATAQYHPLDSLPAGDQGHKALIIRDGTTGLTEIPTAPSSASLTYETREVTLAEDGKASVVETTYASNSLGSSWRQEYSGALDDKQKKSLEDYATSSYSAEKLDKITHGDADDIESPFTLRLEISKARRGYTSDYDAMASIPVPEILNNLPSFLREKPEDEKKKENSSVKPKPDRTIDYILPESTRYEWRYVIHPPAGYVSHGLPESKTEQIGPAVLEQKYALAADGSVSAIISIDAVKRRYTMAEVKQAREAIDKMRQHDSTMISFDLESHQLLTNGKPAEAVAAARKLVALNPKKAIHRIHLAQTLLDAGLGEQARIEAAEAVKLEPKNAKVIAEQGWILEHDLIGRRFEAGFDLEGAERSYAKAVELEPKNESHRANYAILLEFDNEGLRRTAKSRLADAVAQYREISKLNKDEHDFDDNLAMDLYMLGKYDELRTFVAGLSADQTRLALELAAEAVQHGSAKAIAMSSEKIANEQSRQSILGQAADILLYQRRYAEAHDLKQAGLGKDANPQALNRVQMLAKARRSDSLTLSDKKVEDLPLMNLRAIYNNDLQGKLGLYSSEALDDGLTQAKRTEEERKYLQNVHYSLRGNDFTAEGAGDLVVPSAKVTTAGDDAIGYRVALQPMESSTTIYYIVKEKDAYRVVAINNSAAIGRVVAKLLAQGNLEGAAKWLDWRRQQTKKGDGDDSLSGALVAHFWKLGQKPEAEAVRYAAAALQADDKHVAARVIPSLEEGLSKAQKDEDKLRFELALASAYNRSKQWDKLRDAAEKLIAAEPDSLTAFRLLSNAYLNLKQRKMLEDIAQKRIANHPDELAAYQTYANAAMLDGDYVEARRRLRPLIDSGQASASAINSYVWLALFVNKVSAEDIELAQRASSMGNHRDFDVLHTLACLYADAGKGKEAQDTMMEAIKARRFYEPNSAIWYLFGRLAELYGERDSALRSYARVTKEEDTEEDFDSSSTYRLAQMHIKALGGAAK